MSNSEAPQCKCCECERKGKGGGGAFITNNFSLKTVDTRKAVRRPPRLSGTRCTTDAARLCMDRACFVLEGNAQRRLLSQCPVVCRADMGGSWAIGRSWEGESHGAGERQQV